MKKHEMKLRSYQKVHKTEHVEDVERAKIRREGATAKRLQKQAEDRIADLTAADDYDGALDQYAEILHAAKKTDRNSNTHKKRLNELMKNEDLP